MFKLYFRKGGKCSLCVHMGMFVSDPSRCILQRCDLGRIPADWHHMHQSSRGDFGHQHKPRTAVQCQPVLCGHEQGALQLHLPAPPMTGFIICISEITASTVLAGILFSSTCPHQFRLCRAVCYIHSHTDLFCTWNITIVAGRQSEIHTYYFAVLLFLLCMISLPLLFFGGPIVLISSWIFLTVFVCCSKENSSEVLWMKRKRSIQETWKTVQIIQQKNNFVFICSSIFLFTDFVRVVVLYLASIHPLSSFFIWNKLLCL